MKNQNRCSRLRASKRKQKLKHGMCWHQYGSVRDNEAHRSGHDDGKYWIAINISGPRRFAKRCTNRRLRMMFRKVKNEEDVQAMRNSDYSKVFDYQWEIW